MDTLQAMWGRVSALALAAVLVAALVAVDGPDRAVAGHQGTDCGIVSKGSKDYRVRAQQLKCKKARRGAKRYLKGGKALDGYGCDEPAGRIQFFCKSGNKVYWALKL
jgi:hypothetical protein